LASTSRIERVSEIRRLCLTGKQVPEALLSPIVETALGEGPEAVESSQLLFTEVVEPLADRFEKTLCDAYAQLFSRVIAQVKPELDSTDLLGRYQRVRHASPFEARGIKPSRVFVLSRVTLGADVAITSILLDAAKRRFPDAEIYLTGNSKSWELFAHDSRIRRLPADYDRQGSLRERIEAGLALRTELSWPDSIVIDPDSRLSQLGLLPICEEKNYFFFESRAYGGDSADSLGRLTRRWAAETFGVVDAQAYIAPDALTARPRQPGIAISLGVGGNPEKRVLDPFESGLLRGLLKTGLAILVDKGAGGEEAERVDQAIAACGAKPGEIETWDGAFAPFAAAIAGSQLYVGYDSAGQHVSAAARTPLVSVFASGPSKRFSQRWRPSGSVGMEIVPASGNPKQVLENTLDAARSLLGSS
jgi:ADP-heptose:LPS heptosyltransferase